MGGRWLAIAVIGAWSCVSAPPGHDWRPPEIFPLEAADTVRAAGLDVSAHWKYNPLAPGAPIFTPNGFVCDVSARDVPLTPFIGTLVAIAVSADGRELGRAKEKVVLDEEGHPLRFRFNPPLDLGRVARYVIDLEPY